MEQRLIRNEPIDLREYFRQRQETPDAALSPATQALLISALLRKPWNADWQPAETLAQLGYTAMTLSRAVKELAAAGIATICHEGRTRWLHFDRPPAQIWLIRCRWRSAFKTRPTNGFNWHWTN